MSYSRRSPRLCEALTPTVMRHTGVEKSAEAIVVATRRRRAESAVRSRTWIAQTTGKKSEAGNRENLATKGGEVECRDMGARCQGGCGEKENRRTRRTRTVCCRNREVPETGTLRGVGGEAFLPYPILVMGFAWSVCCRPESELRGRAWERRVFLIVYDIGPRLTGSVNKEYNTNRQD